MTDPTDPSTDIANVNAAYVVERDEAQRLARENTKLRKELEALRGVIGNVSHVLDATKVEWKLDGAGDPYPVYGSIHTPDCPACEISNRITAALNPAALEPPS